MFTLNGNELMKVVEGKRKKKKEERGKREGGWVGGGRVGGDVRGLTVEATLVVLALVGEEAGRVLAVDVDVAEHDGGAVGGHVVYVVHEGARELLQRLAAYRRWVLRPLALTRQDRVVLLLEVHYTCCTSKPIYI